MSSVPAPRPVTLVMLAWNAWRHTRQALESLLACELGENEILVVDNGSTDGTAAGLRDFRGLVRVLTLPENRGFVRGNNAGIAAAREGSDVVLLNNDLVFRQHDWLARLSETAHEKPGYGIVGCRLRGGDGRLQHAGSLIRAEDCLGAQIESGRAEWDIGQYIRRREVQGVVFAVAYLKREVIEAIGGLDEAFHTYFEDSDYCLRARAAGFATVLCGDVTLEHVGQASTAHDGGLRERLFNSGHEVFRKRWQDTLRAAYRHRIFWRSALTFPPAWAAVNRGLLAELDRLGIDVRFDYLYRGIEPAVLEESSDAHHFRLNAMRMREQPEHPGVSIICGDAALFARAEGDYRIGYASFAGAEPDAAWLHASQQMDELWVPSEFHRHALQEAGCSAELKVMPFGIDPDYLHPGIRTCRASPDRCTFMAWCRWDELDRPWALADAFRNCFDGDACVRLLLCIDGASASEALAHLEDRRHTHARVDYLDVSHIPGYQRGMLYRSADCLIACSRASDRHLPALEAMACGVAVLGTRFGAMNALLDDSRGFPIGETGQAEADPGALKSALQAVVADPQRARTRGAAAARWVHEHRTWAHTGARILARVQAIDAGPVASTRRQVTARQKICGVVVLGMHRSGTSCVAGLLQMMGVSPGEHHQLLPNAADNPRGFFERIDLHDACREALLDQGADWSVPPLSTQIESADVIERLRDDIAAILDRLQAHTPWLLKEPRLCLLATILPRMLERSVVVHVVRSPQAVARSLWRRDRLSVGQALALWEHYNVCALNASRDRPRLTVDYEALCAAPQATARTLHDELTRFEVGPLRMPQAREIAAWIEPDLQDPSASLPSVTPSESQQALAAALRDGSALESDAAFSTSTESLELLRDLYRQHQQVLAAEKDRGRDV